MVAPRVNAINTSIEAWRLIETDYTLRLSLVSHQWAIEYQQAKKMLFAEARRRNNSAYLGPAWGDMEIVEANKKAEWAYISCCEIWEMQGRPKCRAFFRAIFEYCIQPLLSIVGRFQHEVGLYEDRTNNQIPQGTSIFGHVNREVDRLNADWNTRLEIAIRNSDYQAHLATERDVLIRHTPANAIRQFPNSMKENNPPGPTRRPKKLTKEETRRRAIIFAAIQSNLEGLKYCKELDRRKLHTPSAWISDGCPDTYSKAYNIVSQANWRKRIQDEKYRYGRKYQKTSPTQREHLIQQIPSARATRH